ncbi:DNA replication/repair protein RecF [Marivita hallyeonensis]|uniref:DNA replication and repair protein RecF n=1 Tax=Marivita hallyeonensis TaxID=996342 RepID=A0A1M5UNH0_9RHOB|nr:DNA replication/repair protein RecF [Marivita hallyeonensis]SHH64544.1 DNA replication and repair protein RecF [Marivita hallyeonensis]
MPLRISRLSLSHFRSHFNVVIEMDARPVVLYGPNGAGKTNLIEAVSLFSPGRGMRRASAQDMTRRPEALGWKIDGLVQTPDGLQDISFVSEQGQPRQVKINDKPAPQTRLGELVRVLWLLPSMDRLWIEGAEGRRRFLDRMTLSFFPGHAEASLTYEKAMRERNRLLKDQVRDPIWYKAIEAQMAKSGAQIHANRQQALERILLAQDMASTHFPAAELDLVQTEGEMPDGETELRAALEESRFRDLAAGRTLVGPHRADLYGVFAAKGVPASDSSTGEQKALLISLVLANARALVDDFGSPPIVLLDEVAAHLDASRRAALYDEICALGAQAWMTGTGLELFTELGSRAQYFEVTDAAEGSIVTPINATG